MVAISISSVAKQSSGHINVSISKRNIEVGETFVMTFSSTNMHPGRPDFSPLFKNFTMLYNKSGYKSYSYGNPGSAKSSFFWRLVLRAEKAGKFEIPPIKFGKLQSPRMFITIKKVGSGFNQSDLSKLDSRSVFLRVMLEPGDLYPKQEGLIKVKVFVHQELNGRVYSVSSPDFDVGDAIVKKLRIPTTYTKVINKQAYTVHERQYVIYAQKAGLLKLKPFSVVINIKKKQVQRPFNDPFYNDPTFRGPPRWSRYPRWQRLTRQTESMEVKVKDIPAKVGLQNWLPARHVELKEEWNNSGSSIRVGDAITRVITVSVDGQIPELIPVINFPKTKDIKVYEGNPALHNRTNKIGIVGKRVEKHALIATKAGEFVLPEISVLWWNTNTHKFQTSKIPERKITILPASGVARMVNPGRNSVDKPADANLMGEAPANDMIPMQDKSAKVSYFWHWFSGFMFLLWLGTLSAWIYSAKMRPQTTKVRNKHSFASEQRASDASLRNKIKQACLHNQAKQCRDALLEWGQLHFGRQLISNLNQLIDKLDSPNLTIAFKELDRHLYSRDAAATDWSGEDLWQEFSQIKLDKQTVATNKTRSGLAPFNPV